MNVEKHGVVNVLHSNGHSIRSIVEKLRIQRFPVREIITCSGRPRITSVEEDQSLIFMPKLNKKFTILEIRSR